MTSTYQSLLRANLDGRPNAIPWSTIKESQMAMEVCNAFYEPNKADREGIRLMMPSMITNKNRTAE